MKENSNGGFGCLGLILVFLLGYASWLLGQEESEKVLPDHIIYNKDGSKIEYYNVKQRTQVDTGYYQTESQIYQQSTDSLRISRRIYGDWMQASPNF